MAAGWGWESLRPHTGESYFVKTVAILALLLNALALFADVQVMKGFTYLQDALVQRCQELYVVAGLGHVL